MPSPGAGLHSAATAEACASPHAHSNSARTMSHVHVPAASVRCTHAHCAVRGDALGRAHLQASILCRAGLALAPECAQMFAHVGSSRSARSRKRLAWNRRRAARTSLLAPRRMVRSPARHPPSLCADSQRVRRNVFPLSVRTFTEAGEILTGWCRCFLLLDSICSASTLKIKLVKVLLSW